MKINRCFHFLNMFAHLQEKISTTFILPISKSFSKYFCFSNLLKFGNFSMYNKYHDKLHCKTLFSWEHVIFATIYSQDIEFCAQMHNHKFKINFIAQKNQNVHIWKIFRTNISEPYSVCGYKKNLTEEKQINLLSVSRLQMKMIGRYVIRFPWNMKLKLFYTAFRWVKMRKMNESNGSELLYRYNPIFPLAWTKRQVFYSSQQLFKYINCSDGGCPISFSTTILFYCVVSSICCLLIQ